jgi:PKD repeat protein
MKFLFQIIRGFLFYALLSNQVMAATTNGQQKLHTAANATPIASFSLSDSILLVNQFLYINNSSSNSATNFLWTITGSSGVEFKSSNANSQNPQLTFVNAGIYVINLVASNQNGSSSLSKTIRVLGPACADSNFLHASILSNASIFNITTNVQVINSVLARRYQVLNQKLQVPKSDSLKLWLNGVNTFTSFRAWVDFDLDGFFESNESFSFTYNNSNQFHEGKIFFPRNLPLGAYPARVRTNVGSLGSTDACTRTFSSTSMTVDFMMQVVNGSGDTEGPILSEMNPQESFCTPQSRMITSAIRDVSGISSAVLDWKVNGRAMSPMPLTRSGSAFSVQIPAQGNSLVEFRIIATDSSILKNITEGPWQRYQDAYLSAYYRLPEDRSVLSNDSILLGARSVASIGTENLATQNLNDVRNPFSTDFAGRKVQMIYSAKELRANGLQAGYLNSCSFEVAALAAQEIKYPGFTISIGVNKGSFNFLLFENGQNVVYGPIVYIPVSQNGWLNFPFKQAYYWDGSSDIVVTIAWGSGGHQALSVLVPIQLKYSSTTNPYMCYFRSNNMHGDKILSQTNYLSLFSERLNAKFLMNEKPGSITWQSNQAPVPFNPANLSAAYAKPGPSSGTYSYIMNVQDGPCVHSDTVNLLLITPPAVELGPNGAICGQARMLDAGNPYSTYVWTLNGGFFSNSRVIYAKIAGRYKVKVNNIAGVEAVDSIDLILGSNFSNPIPNYTLCSPKTIVVDAGAHSSYLWSTGASTRTLSISNAGTYWVEVRNDVGCAYRDTFSVSIGTSLPINLPDSTPICSGSPAELDAFYPDATYLWSTGATTSKILANLPGVYWVIVTSNITGCSKFDSTIVVNNPGVQANLGNDKVFCSNQIVELDAGEFDSYLWSTGAQTRKIIPTTAGNYWVRVSNKSGCVDFDTITITHKPAPSLQFGVDKTFCFGDSVELDAGPGYAKYLWSTGSVNQKIKVYNTSTVWCKIENDANCFDSDTIALTERAEIPAIMTYDQVDSLSRTVHFTATPLLAHLYLWDFGDPASSSNVSRISNPIHLFTKNGQYIVRCSVTNFQTGCVKELIDTIQVNALFLDNANAKGAFDINLFPNPSSESIALIWDDAQIEATEFVIVDGVGRRLMQGMIKNRQSIDVSNLSPGVYQVVILNQRKKFVKN